MTRQEIEQATWNFLKSKGLNDYTVSAIMGNIEAESEFDPNLVEHGSGVGFGLCQWSYSRRTQLEAYGTDLQHQFNFLWAELSGEIGTTGATFQWINKNGYLNHTQFMSGQGSLNDLTSAFCFSWERPDPVYAHLARRQTSANTYYNTYAVGQPTNPPIDPPEDPPKPGEFMLRNNYFYNCIDSLLGRKFVTPRKTFTLIKNMGDMSIILDGNLRRKVPRKNIIN